MKRVLCIRLPSWPIQRLVVAQPELRDRVIMLHARDARRGQTVVACSRAAYRRGIRPGMPLAEATSLEQHAVAIPSTISPQSRASAIGSEPYITAHQPQSDEQVLEQLAQWCEQFSPLVGFELLDPFHDPSAARRSDCLYLDVTNLAAYFGDERQLAYRVTQSFVQRGYHVRVALADTLGAAWAFAHFATRDAEALGASPTGSSFLVVAPGDLHEALRALPIQALRLPPDTISLLRQLGLLHIAQLAGVPRTSLRSRFGNTLLRRWDQAFGDADEVLLMHRPAPRFQAEWSLEHPTTDQAIIRHILEQLTERLATALTQRGEGVVECLCRLLVVNPLTSEPVTPSPTTLAQHPASSPLSLRIGLFQPTASVSHLCQLWQMQMQRLLLPAPVQHMVLQATITTPLERRQRELFPDASGHTSQQLAQLVDRLSSRLGQQHVVRPRQIADAQPEFAYHYVPLTGNRPAKRAGVRPPLHRPSSRSIPARGPRPLHLRSPPLPLAEVAVVPDGPPVRLLLSDRSCQVARYWGPERIETGWWRGRAVGRDYYRVETESGHWLWLFRRLQDGHWFLHGMFG